jgi:hypothetical protein
MWIGTKTQSDGAPVQKEIFVHFVTPSLSPEEAYRRTISSPLSKFCAIVFGVDTGCCTRHANISKQAMAKLLQRAGINYHRPLQLGCSRSNARWCSASRPRSFTAKTGPLLPIGTAWHQPHGCTRYRDQSMDIVFVCGQLRSFWKTSFPQRVHTY